MGLNTPSGVTVRPTHGDEIGQPGYSYLPVHCMRFTWFECGTDYLTATVLPPHSSPPGIHHVITVTHIGGGGTERHRQIGPLQVKITGATMTGAHITTKHGGNEKRDSDLPKQFQFSDMVSGQSLSPFGHGAWPFSFFGGQVVTVCQGLLMRGSGLGLAPWDCAHIYSPVTPLTK
ncbi:hypothetical protein BDR22DRAFT_884788 [Usnea florida]